MVLTILEVSRKQAYIFSSNALADNIRHSREIAEISGSAYMQTAVDETGINIKDHLVYTGGGHTVLEFESFDISRMAVSCISKKVLMDLPEIELFAASVEYDDQQTPRENMKHLTAALEKKKALRCSSFHQGTFGIEETDVNTGKPIRIGQPEDILQDFNETAPQGYCLSGKIEDLVSPNFGKRFVAIIHADGNAMGRQVESIAASFGKGEWEKYKDAISAFSERVDLDFKDAYQEMVQDTADILKMVDRSTPDQIRKYDVNMKGDTPILPLRRIISEGDDICFIADGRFALDCTSIFLKKLQQKGYTACAGIALVHVKYPFYKAYQLAEALCSNAKSFGVGLAANAFGKERAIEDGAKVAAIDWHVEYGEIQNSLEDTRAQYLCADGARLDLKPYIVYAPEEILRIEPIRQYENYQRLMVKISKSYESKNKLYASGRLKQLREVLKRGEQATDMYLTFHKLEELGRDLYQDIFVAVDYENIQIGSGKDLERAVFVETADKKKRCLLFDGIEMMDTYVPLEEVAG